MLSGKGRERINATRPATCYRNYHLLSQLRSTLTSLQMDDIRGSLSKMKEDIKHRLTGKKRKVDKAQAGGHGVGVDSSGSLPPQSVTSGDRQREGKEPGAGDESVGPSAAADESESDWTTTATASAKLLLRGVSRSSDAFGPLKSVASGLCFILENCEVRLSPRVLSVSLTGPSAHEGEQVSDRIVGTQSQDPQREALSACS